MKFKVSFARIVNEAQMVEALIVADSLDEAQEKLSTGEFERFLVVKRDTRNITEVGRPDFEPIK